MDWHEPEQESPDEDLPLMRTLFCVLLFQLLACSLQAACPNGTCTAASPALADVQAALSQAVNGDTINIPAGTASWAGQLSVTKAVNIIGAGVNSTVITDNSTSPSLVVLNNVASGGVTRLSGIRFQKGTGVGRALERGLIDIAGSNTSGWQVRIHHNEFFNFPGTIISGDSAIGVVDHNKFHWAPWSNPDQALKGEKTYLTAMNWDNNPSDGFAPTNGDGSWASPTNFGGINLLVFEDNFFDGTYANGTWGDGKQGGRGVYRHNTFIQGQLQNGARITCHGTEPATQSIRHIEVYNNLTVKLTGGQILNQRGGTGVVFNERVLSIPTGTIGKITLTSDRVADPTFWGRASGNNIRDINDTTGTVNDGSAGTNADPKPFYSGTAGPGTSRTRVYVSPSPNWPIDKWVGYQVSNTTKPANVWGNNPADGGDFQKGSSVDSSDANSMTLNGTIFKTTNLEFDEGDNFKIYRVKNGTQQPGRGGSLATNLLIRDAANPPSPRFKNDGTVGNRESSEPWYAWNCRYKDGAGNLHTIVFAPSTTYIRACTGNNDDECHFYQNVDTAGNQDHVMPGYPWSATKTATIGATGMGLTGNNAPLVIAGYGDYNGIYPHSLVTGDVGGGPTPVITSAPSATFCIGASNQSFQVTWENFSGTPVSVTKTVTSVPTGATAGQLPTNVSLGSGGLFSGSATGAVPGDYVMTLTATYAPPTPDETATQTFTLRAETNQSPTVAIASPANGATYTAPATIGVVINAADLDGSVTEVRLYRGTALIATFTGPPYTYTQTNVPAGDYTYRAEATDSCGATVASSTIAVSVNAAATAPLAPARIEVRP
jgi:hypothetical protein